MRSNWNVEDNANLIFESSSENYTSAIVTDISLDQLRFRFEFVHRLEESRCEN